MKLLSTFFSSITLWIILGSTCVGQETSILYPFSMDRAQPGYRAGRFELFVLGQYWNAEAFKLDGVRLQFPYGDPSVRYPAEFIHTVGIIPGFGFAYNINNHFAVRSEFTFRHQDYIVQIVQSPGFQEFQRGNAFVHEGKFNLDYNILSSKFTPFVSAGVGYLYLGADDRTSFPEWHLDLNAAAGVRWDITDHLFLKAYAGGSWANVDQPDWAATFQATVAAGWRF